MTPAALRITCLGSALVTDGEAEPLAFPTQKALALLIYLSIESGRPHRREALAGFFWPDLTDEAARLNLRKTLERLRTTLAQGGVADVLRIDAQSVAFAPSQPVDVDATAFVEALAAAEGHVHRSPDACPACAARWTEAALLYRGDFLNGFSLKDSSAFEEWLLVKREHYRRLAVDALNHLVRQAQVAGDHAATRRWIRQLLALEPWREEAHRDLMRRLALDGERSAALAQFGECERALIDFFGLEPALETRSLAERIASGPALSEPEAVLQRLERRQRLPRPAAELVGRSDELRRLLERLADPKCRLISVIGLGGIGKTHLALTAAPLLDPMFVDGVAFASLSEIDTLEAVPAALASALGFRMDGEDEPLKALGGYLQARQLLLILDSVEHLLPPDETDSMVEAGQGAGVLDVIVTLLERAPGLVVLVTSRVVLQARAEWVIELEGLAVPPESIAEPERILSYDSVRMFLDRSRQAGRERELAPSDARAVGRLCRVVEGLPLAIEIAAASWRRQPLADLVEQVAASIDALAHGPRDLPARQRSLRATVDHSWNLLAPDEQRLLSRLSVFRGGADLEASRAVADGNQSDLERLMDQSLVRREAENRFGLHEVVRQFAAEQLERAGDIDACRLRHLTYFVSLAEAGAAKTGTAREAWAPVFTREHDNLLAALRYADEQNHIELGLSLAGCLWYAWNRFGLVTEGCDWLTRLLHRADAVDVDDFTRSRALDGLAVLLWRQGDLPAAAAAVEQAIALKNTIGDRAGLALAWVHRGLVHFSNLELDEAEHAYREGLAHYRALGDQVGATVALHNLGNLAVQRGDHAGAVKPYEECLALYEETGDMASIALLCLGLGTIALETRDLDRAAAHYARSAELARQVGDPFAEATALTWLGVIAHERGQLDRAEELINRAIPFFATSDDDDGLGIALNALGSVAADRGNRRQALQLFQRSLETFASRESLEGLVETFERIANVALTVRPEQAVRLLAHARQLRHTAELPLPAYRESQVDKWMSELRARLGSTTFEKNEVQGTSLSTAEMTATARDLCASLIHTGDTKA